MTADDYKKRFIALFQEMEKELGTCNSVEIEREDEVAYMGEIVKSTYTCRMRF